MWMLMPFFPDENEREEGQLPYGNLSDSEVEGDFVILILILNRR